MNIRKYNENEINYIVELWCEVSKKSHDFINPKYWEEKKEDMAIEYIPMSETYVIEDNGKILGFVSMVDNYLAALFIDSNYHNKGYGNKLLNFVKERRDEIQLNVYEKNKKAYGFYLRNGFILKDELIDNDTGEKDYLMIWKSN
ncbi:GNAT family N-acetyltransferase [Clostridium sp. UBA6640]|uniref:GNAT family N-acetyltransferase n=1 Tax=Clostridium sp. UBA6640 TaxID=1946370 RepID=UPI0025BF6D14|nr:GNAT family N-acetyltransferase [Clostridium sp. UBA6640]